MELAPIIVEILLVACERDEKVAARFRRALGIDSSADFVRLVDAAAELGVKPRVLRDARRRGQLHIEGPRAARVIRRAELARYLAATAPQSDFVIGERSKSPRRLATGDGTARERTTVRETNNVDRDVAQSLAQAAARFRRTG